MTMSFTLVPVGEGARGVGRAVGAIGACREHHHSRHSFQMERTRERELLVAPSEPRAFYRERKLASGEKGRAARAPARESGEPLGELPSDPVDVPPHVGAENLGLEA